MLKKWQKFDHWKIEKQRNLLTILENIQFLSRQGLAFRGNNEGRNFDQLLKLSSKSDPQANGLAKNMIIFYITTQMEAFNYFYGVKFFNYS